MVTTDDVKMVKNASLEDKQIIHGLCMIGRYEI